MSKPKFLPGQNVEVSMYNPWIGDYQMPTIVIRQDDVYFNGTPSYIVKRGDEEYRQVPEDRIIVGEEAK